MPLWPLISSIWGLIVVREVSTPSNGALGSSTGHRKQFGGSLNDVGTFEVYKSRGMSFPFPKENYISWDHLWCKRRHSKSWSPSSVKCDSGTTQPWLYIAKLAGQALWPHSSRAYALLGYWTEKSFAAPPTFHQVWQATEGMCCELLCWWCMVWFWWTHDERNSSDQKGLCTVAYTCV